jgi:prepilin-type N-terminal cleavage/methylation domain-containing protein
MKTRRRHDRVGTQSETSGEEERMQSRRTLGRRQHGRGFTLIELLTVIAIIAVLAAILYPVMSIARQNARKGGCRNNLHAIIQGLKMYYDDWGVYPDSLMGIEYTGTASYPGQPYTFRLGREYVKDDGAFTCPDHPQALKGITTLVNPMDPRTGAAARQFPNDSSSRPINFQARDSYDMQYYPNLPTPGTPYLTFTRKWSLGPAGLSDDPRQLAYRNTPDSTVVTWCMYHSHMNASGVPERGQMALVAFLSGRVQDIPAEKLVWSATNLPWQVPPKP